MIQYLLQLFSWFRGIIGTCTSDEDKQITSPQILLMSFNLWNHSYGSNQVSRNNYFWVNFTMIQEPIYIFEVLIGISKGPTLLCMLYKSHLVSFSPLLLTVNKSCCAYFQGRACVGLKRFFLRNPFWWVKKIQLNPIHHISST